MKQIQREPEEKQQNSIAQILSSIPAIVWEAFFILVLVLVGLSVIGHLFPHTGVAAFMDGLLAWVVRILIVSGALIGVRLLYAGYCIVHDVRLKHAEYQSMLLTIQAKEQKVRTAKAEANIIEQFPALYQMALERGLNVKFKGGMEIQSPFSNVHTLGNGGMPQNVIDANPLAQIAPPAMRRLTVDEICSHIERNSYKVFIGSSLTKQLTPVEVSIFKRHMKIIGATQKGKSSFSAAFLTIVTETHDPAAVQFALLDYQYQTTRLFADIPHLVSVVRDDASIRLHATTIEEVVEYLNYCYQIMVARSKMSRTAVSKLPLLVVFIEEFLRLKKELKSACKTAQDKEAAALRYEQFSFAIGAIAGLGLREKVQLLLIAQMDYADVDPELQEAMVNITSGISFCVKRSAALAAGFYNTDLINKNAQANQPGTAVVEMPDCNDLILAPDFPLEQKLLAREAEEIEAEEEQEPDIPYTGPYLLKSGPSVQQHRASEPDAPTMDTPPSLPAVRPHTTRKATLSDAIEVWNEAESEMGSPKLRKELIARGLECSDSLSRQLLANVKSCLEDAK